MISKAKSNKDRYDSAAPAWGDKMRALGYYDAYLGFLAAEPNQAATSAQVIDIGAGTAAFSEAWVAINGTPENLTLLDPSRAMLERGQAVMHARGIKAVPVQGLLGESRIDPADEALAAHVIEHCSDPSVALRQIRDLIRPGGKLHLVVSKPHWCNSIIWLQWRHRTFGRKEIASLVEKSGFSIDSVYKFPIGPPSRTSRGILATRLR